MEPNLENLVVGGWVEFGSLPKTDAVQEKCDKAHCCGAVSNRSFILIIDVAGKALYFSHCRDS
jgi:hypothetical protein